MAVVELHEDNDGYLYCPQRGEIDVQWCLGCPGRIKITYKDRRAVVVCDPATDKPHRRDRGPLADVPDSFKTY